MGKISTLFLTLCSASLLFVSCEKELPNGVNFVEDHYGERGAVVTPSNVETGFFDLGDPANSKISFDLDATGETVNSTEIFASLNGGPEVSLETISSLPTNVEVTMNGILSVLGTTSENVEIGDQVTLTFSPTTSSGTYRSSSSLGVPFSCLSDLAGTYDYRAYANFCQGDEATGQIEFIEQGAGLYTLDDWTFQSYPICYDGFVAAGFGTLQLQDVCNVISVIGVDNYGDSYSWQLNSITGPDLDITWNNTYGEGGSVIITRPDGSDWPPLVIE